METALARRHVIERAGHTYIVMELCAGMVLIDYINIKSRPRLPEREARQPHQVEIHTSCHGYFKGSY